MKVFISQPMNGRTKEEIMKERDLIFKYLLYKENMKDLSIIDSFFEDAPEDAKPLWYIGESLKLMSKADLVVLAPGWDKAKGCRVEYDCAHEYGLSCLHLASRHLYSVEED